ncbi:hypothetical protein [Sulfitobacter sp.]|uniref:hypothetical protein n=1 Tax=Sulfitobacter sp. TaxID=1903071 RepID=UPI00356832F6
MRRIQVKWNRRDGIVNSFWHGGRLTWIERACMRSFLDKGIKFRLYAYGELDGVPDGVQLEDAAEILPETAIITYQGDDLPEAKGTPALFSNLFRYELQRLGKGLWVDCDFYCLKPFRFARMPFVFGYQHNRTIDGAVNTAVLKLPKDSRILADLIKLYQPPYSIPPWVFQDHRARLAKQWGSEDVHPSYLPWGSFGPKALTALIWRHGLEEHILGRDRFYPITVADIEKMFDPAVDCADFFSPRTFGVHLWNNEIRHRAAETPPEGSFAHRLWLEGQ